MSEAAVGGEPHTAKLLATWMQASWPRRGCDAPPRTPAPLPLPAGRSRPLPSPGTPSSSPQVGPGFGGRDQRVTGG